MSYGSIARPLRSRTEAPNDNPFLRGRNRFPFCVTQIPDNDNRFPLSDNAFSDTGNDLSAEFPLVGLPNPANDEELADLKGSEISDKQLLLQRSQRK